MELDVVSEADFRELKDRFQSLLNYLYMVVEYRVNHDAKKPTIRNSGSWWTSIEEDINSIFPNIKNLIN